MKKKKENQPAQSGVDWPVAILYFIPLFCAVVDDTVYQATNFFRNLITRKK